MNKSKEPLISVLMSVYNNESTLPEAIESVLAQSYGNFEFIIIDDSSTDRSWNIINKYKRIDSRIRAFQNESNLGLAASLNKCLRLANGQYCARMDGDDICRRNRFEVQLTFLQSHPEVDLVGSWMQAFNRDGLIDVIKVPTQPTKYDLPYQTPFCHPTIMLKTEVYRRLNGYTVTKRTKRTEDLELWYRFFEEGFKGVNLTDPLYLMRLDEDAFKRRKLKYAFDAAVITFKGCVRLKLPVYYLVFSAKPVISWGLPESLKSYYRDHKHWS